MRVWLLPSALLSAVLLIGCGDPPSTPPPRVLKEQGDQLAEEARWAEAADLYGQAFAMEDPVEVRAKARAFLALRRAVALKNSGHPADGLAWLRWAERLDPALRIVHFHRGRILDGSYPSATDLAAAKASYERYLELVTSAGITEQEQPFVDVATMRLKLLE